MPPPTGVVSGPLMPMRRSRNAATVSSGSQVLKRSIAFSPAKTSYQDNAALAVVCDLDRGIEHAHRRFPDVAPGAVAFDERDDGVVGNDELAVESDFASRWRVKEFRCKKTPRTHLEKFE